MALGAELSVIMPSSALSNVPRRERTGGLPLRVGGIQARDDLALPAHSDRLDAGGADVKADERLHQPPSAAYTSSYAATASFRCCAARSAGSSIRAATESMNCHCSTERLTAAT